ncbi:MAG TPA: SgcJ/EcaC family oxidoreductase [Pyrinomonadaceae bacterium]|nr:SgcJ/EcaC family oxidoreductase [Pyrinomonadaceae bacterium]
MSRPRNLFAVTILALIYFGFAPHVTAQTASTANTDEAAIRHVVQQVQDAWNTHDGKAFAAQFAADADYVVVNGLYLKGRDAIEKGHVGIFTTIYKDSRNVATFKSVRFLRPDVAVAHVEWNLEFKVGGETRKGHAMNTMFMTKEGGKWSIAAFQNTPIQPEGR